MDYIALAAELLSEHPVSGAYKADAQLAANQINALDVPRVKASMSGSEMFLNTDAGEFAVLTTAKKSEWLSFCGIGGHDPANNGVAHQFVDYIFGAGATLIALAAARMETVSQGQAIGVGKVNAGHVIDARAI